ncbi:hypothetical protein PSTT_11160 [Puccinia striiformis]|uniref:SGS domain-containing protein n=1 Tax=Puccinia striiformis TaxID=27350 RepID=A0A2S4V1H5_9BASI|nr:hypothetical protein PSTT_11160 [Puccinia striiformis]
MNDTEVVLSVFIKNTKAEHSSTEEESGGISGSSSKNELGCACEHRQKEEEEVVKNLNYVESNGTALSTDWNDVSKKTVETRPPDSMVAKSWKK